MPEKEVKKLSILADICMDRAREEGIELPSRNVIVVRLENDPYTWVIVKLGLKDKELFRTRMSIEDVTMAEEMAEKEED